MSDLKVRVVIDIVDAEGVVVEDYPMLAFDTDDESMEAQIMGAIDDSVAAAEMALDPEAPNE